MTDTELKLRAAKAFVGGFSGVIRIAPEGGVPFDIDGRKEVCAIVAAGDAAPDCVWRASAETLTRVFEGGRALESSYLSGRLFVAGDMSVMARLVLESSR
ncbi:MAG: SCP2 sterol-binding domain-containing protein [Pseudomonadota bacterium]